MNAVAMRGRKEEKISKKKENNDIKKMKLRK